MIELERSPRRLWMWSCLLGVLVLAWVLGAEQSDPGPPEWLELVPNAIQDEDHMAVIVGGIPQGGVVHFEVLRDCNGDGKPEPKSVDDCRSPVHEWNSVPADDKNIVNEELDFRDLGTKGVQLPTNKVLWLRASRPGSRHTREVIFGIVDDPCDLWETVIENFLGGRCDPHLAQALVKHRSETHLEDLTFEVRLIEMDGKPTSEGVEAVSVPGTLGATGVSWLDEKRLLVTVAATAISEEDDGDLRPAEPGLYQISLAGGPTKLLWAPDAGDLWRPVAPLALPDCRIALVRQPLGNPPAGEPAALLHIWRDGRLDEGIPLPYKVHQLVAGDARGSAVLALTLGREQSLPAFMKVDLPERTVEHLGYHHGLYHAAMRSPVGEISVVSAEDVTERLRWFLILVDENGQWVKDLQVREDLHDILPAWHPDGMRIAFLGENPKLLAEGAMN